MLAWSSVLHGQGSAALRTCRRHMLRRAGSCPPGVSTLAFRRSAACRIRRRLLLPGLDCEARAWVRAAPCPSSDAARPAGTSSRGGSSRDGVDTRSSQDEDGNGSSKGRPWSMPRPPVILPFGYRYVFWTTVTTVAAAATGLLVPWEVAFQTPDQLLSGTSWAGAANLGLSALFLADLAISFRTAYFEGDELVDDRPSVARHYALSSQFLIDLAGALPLDWLLLGACSAASVLSGGGDGEGGGVDVCCGGLAWLPLLRLLQLARLYRLKNFFGYLEYNLSVSLLNVTIARNLAIVGYVVHWLACAFYIEGLHSGFNSEVLFGADGPFLQSLSSGDAYLYSLYWSVTTLSMVEANQVASTMAQTLSATIRASLFMGFNILVASYILGTITLLVVKNDERAGKFRDQSRNIKQFTEANSIPPELKASMQDHLRLFFDSNAHEASDDQVLSIFPTTIRRRIMQYLYLPLLRRSYLFEGVQQRYLDALLAAARVEVFMPGVDIVISGDTVNDLFMLVSGTGEVICPRPSCSLAARAAALASADSASSANSAGTSSIAGAAPGLTGGSFGSGSLSASLSGSLSSLDSNSDLPASLQLSAMQSPLTNDLEGERSLVQEGAVLGEAAFFTEVPQLEAVRASGVCRLLVFSRAAFASLERAFPTSSRRVLENLMTKAEMAVGAEFDGQLLRSADLDSLWAQFSALDYSWASTELRDSSTGSLLRELPSLDEVEAADVASCWSPRQQQVVANLLRIRALVRAKIQQQEYERTTEFLWAAAGGDATAVRQSLSSGAVSANAADYDGRTALELACAGGHLETVKVLLAAGASADAVDNLGSCALLEAAKGGHDDLMALLLRHGARLVEGEVKAASVLCTCVFEGDLRLLRRLMRAHADVNAGDYDKRTALHISAAEGNLQAVRLLVEEGRADVNVTDRWGHTPLDEAKRVGAAPVMRFLQAHSLDRSASCRGSRRQ